MGFFRGSSVMSISRCVVKLTTAVVLLLISLVPVQADWSIQQITDNNYEDNGPQV